MLDATRTPGGRPFGASFVLTLSVVLIADGHGGTLRAGEAVRSTEGQAVPSLDFEARVACQRAVEEVYWRHRIWPESNVEPKPSPTELLPEGTVRRKVEALLLASGALAEWWGQRLNGEPLQREIDRMFAETRAPGVLREISAALGNDAFLFAECVARPALVDRLLRSFYAQDERFGDEPLEGWLEGQRHAAALELGATGYAYELPPRPVSTGATGDEERWTPTASLPEGIAGISSVWTGSEMIIWGGARSNGSRYDPATDTWSTTAAIGAPSPRKEHSAVWTGAEMIVWGGCGQATNFCELGNGARYDPAADVWTQTSNIDAPILRRRHVAVWTGAEMVIWGGCRTSSSGPGNNNCAIELDSGARYDPSTDSWTPMSTVDAPGKRVRATGVWTGSEVVVWGGYDGGDEVNDGGRYDPAGDSWAPTSLVGAPGPRSRHTAVWTGIEMIVWGGCGGGFCFWQFPYFGDGGRYDPAADTWTGVGTTGAPVARGDHTAVWTGAEMIVWGGATEAGDTDTGGRYDPATDTWSAISALNAPSPRSAHRAVWTGSHMVVWGAAISKTGGRYDTATDTWTPTNTSDPEEARTNHVAVWTGAEMLVWGGDEVPDSLGPGRGDRYDPATAVWTPMSTANAPDQREHGFTAVWTGNEMLVWGGQIGTWLYDTGGRYDPAGDTWQATTTADAPSPRAYHAAVWTGSQMVVWGGNPASGGFETNTGGRYDPALDRWAPTTTVGAPSARRFPSAVWTGSEVLVWGGLTATSDTPTGGRYDPVLDTWAATATKGAPVGRHYHTVLWSGDEMLVWGGMAGNFDSPTYLDDGARYHPPTDTWLAISPQDAPSPRVYHVSAWTGSEMLIWGGCTGTTSCPNGLYTGARYDPSSDTWAALTTQSAPSARKQATSVWTGSEMIVWGGHDDVNGTYTTTGAALDPYVLPLPQEVSPPGSEQPLQWTGPSALLWESGAVNGAETFNLYRGSLGGSALENWGACHDSGVTTNGTEDTDNPASGEGWGYLVSGVNAAGEGSLGQASDGTQRVAATSCP